jgi:hypothetical protein
MTHEQPPAQNAMHVYPSLQINQIPAQYPTNKCLAKPHANADAYASKSADPSQTNNTSFK